MTQLWPHATSDGKDGRPAPIQTTRVVYQLTSTDQSNGFVTLQIPVPVPYPDTNYTVQVTLQVDAGESQPPANAPLVKSVSPSAITVQQIFTTGVSGFHSGDAFRFHVVFIHD